MTDSTSIVIPAYNEAVSVGRLVTALRGTAMWHEILVVDDGSDDGTGDRASAAGARVIRHPYNKGNGAAVKTGIRQATGRYVSEQPLKSALIAAAVGAAVAALVLAIRRNRRDYY